MGTITSQEETVRRQNSAMFKSLGITLKKTKGGFTALQKLPVCLCDNSSDQARNRVFIFFDCSDTFYPLIGIAVEEEVRTDTEEVNAL